MIKQVNVAAQLKRIPEGAVMPVVVTVNEYGDLRAAVATRVSGMSAFVVHAMFAKMQEYEPALVELMGSQYAAIKCDSFNSAENGNAIPGFTDLGHLHVTPGGVADAVEHITNDDGISMFAEFYEDDESGDVFVVLTDTTIDTIID